jgi:hypothetical protein
MVTLMMIVSAWFLFMRVNHPRAAEQTEPPDEIVLDEKGYSTDRKGEVDFAHLSHAEDYGVSCTECHHEYKDGKNTWEEGDPVKKCASCHDPNEDKGPVKKLKTAFHKNCKACHQNLAKEGITKDAPYRKCSDCHARKSE